MKTLTLRSRFQGHSTMIDNDFIDSYMIRANGEYVKVYLYLLRHLNNPEVSLTLSTIADSLENTEKDILRALVYWEKTGLLSIEYDASGKMTALNMGSGELLQEPEQTEPPAAPTKVILEEKPAKAASKDNRKAFKQLLFIAEQYLGKTLTKTDIEAITYFFDELQFSSDLIEYLIEHCVENNHKSMHYIKTVALAWAEAGIKTIEQARCSSVEYNKICFSVLKAFGITGRGPAASELCYMKRWSEEYGFSLDLIVEACNRTISNTHQPNFDYADSILRSWLDNKVHHLTDIAKLDEAYKKEKAKKAAAKAKPVISNRFNNFQGRTYDIDSLEEQLLNSK